MSYPFFKNKIFNKNHKMAFAWSLKLFGAYIALNVLNFLIMKGTYSILKNIEQTFLNNFL